MQAIDITAADGTAEQGEYLGQAGWARNPAGVVAALAQWLAGWLASLNRPRRDLKPAPS
jgi:hypothetical protein